MDGILHFRRIHNLFDPINSGQHLVEDILDGKLLNPLGHLLHGRWNRRNLYVSLFEALQFDRCFWPKEEGHEELSRDQALYLQLGPHTSFHKHADPLLGSEPFKQLSHPAEPGLLTEG